MREVALRIEHEIGTKVVVDEQAPQQEARGREFTIVGYMARGDAWTDQFWYALTPVSPKRCDPSIGNFYVTPQFVRTV